MDTISKTHDRPALSSPWRLAVLVAGMLVLSLTTGLLASNKPPSPLDLHNKPALLFFNNKDGCACALSVYRKADAEIVAWALEMRRNVPVVWIHLDARPDLQMQYRIVRAPTLLLLDATGQEAHRQEEVVSDQVVFDLSAFETKIDSILETAPQ